MNGQQHILVIGKGGDDRWVPARKGVFIERDTVAESGQRQ